MAASFEIVARLTARKDPARHTATAAVLRSLLVVGCVGAMAATIALVDASALPRVDPELARLLRGMAVIKALLLGAAIAVLLWRFGLPIRPAVAGGYGFGVLSMAVATALIWQLTWLLPAAAAFHVGLFVLLGIAWRGDRDRPTASRAR